MNFFLFLSLGASIFSLSHQKSIFLDQKFTTGLVQVNPTKSQIFFWHFPSRSNSTADPIIFFLSGSSSIYQVFNNSGPFLIHDNSELSLNPLSWNSRANLVYIDSPSCIGFSNTRLNLLKQNTKQAMRELEMFFHTFYQKYPEYKKRKTLFTGDSYAGHYIPSILSDSSLREYFDLQGVILIGGWVNGQLQSSSIGDYLLEKNILSQEDYETKFKKLNELCKNTIKLDPKCQMCQIRCQKEIKSYKKLMADKNILFDKNPKLDKKIYQFLNHKNVKKLLKVEPDKKWKRTNQVVQFTRQSDQFVDYSKMIKFLILEGIEVKILYGRDDIFWNYQGGLKWVNSMIESQTSKLNENNLQDFEIDGKIYGKHKRLGKLEFFIINDAGHQIAQYQPLPVFKIVSQLINDLQ